MSKSYEKADELIRNSAMTEEEKRAALEELLKNKSKKSDVLITGATGVGKSFTINTLFNADKALVGTVSDPETMHIAKFQLR